MADSPREELGVVGSWESNNRRQLVQTHNPSAGRERPEGRSSEFHSPWDTWAVSDHVYPSSDSLSSLSVCMTPGSAGLALLVFAQRPGWISLTGVFSRLPSAYAGTIFKIKVTCPE